MPRKSEKCKIIEILINKGVYDVINEDSDEDDDIAEEALHSVAVVQLYRYGVPFIKGSIPKSRNYFGYILPQLDQKRLKIIARVERETFKFILNEIANDPIFHIKNSWKQIPVEVQLLVTLYRLGCCGEGASIAKIDAFFGLGNGGTIQNLTKRVFAAILKLKHKYLFWPNTAEREDIVAETYTELPYCIGYVDGTEIKLAEKPRRDHSSYFSRKHQYSIKTQVVCDHKKMIRHVVVGYPGSVHDSRIFKECHLSRDTSAHFTGCQWILGDSAYKLSKILITPFRSNSTNSSNAGNRHAFNKHLSLFRIRVEHCFGHLKERFSSLKELNIPINNDNSLKFICQWILTCSILHNMIITSQINDEIYIESQNELDEDVNFFETFDSGRNVEAEMKRNAIMEIVLSSL